MPRAHLLLVIGWTLICCVGMTATASATGRSYSHKRLSASKKIGPAGGKVKLRNGAQLLLPPNTVVGPTSVTIKQLTKTRYDFHIHGSWEGLVRVTMPRSRGGRYTVHRIGGVWLPEGPAGRRTVWVSQLSPLDWVKSKAQAATCFYRNAKDRRKLVVCVIEKLGNKAAASVVKWVADKLGKSCYAHVAANAATKSALAIPTTLLLDDACVPHTDPGTFAWPTAPSTLKVVNNPGGSQTETFNPQAPRPSSAPASPGMAPAAPAPASTPSPAALGPAPNPAPSGGVTETAGGVVNTWTNPANAGGTQGPSIQNGQQVGIQCKLHGFRVANGNDWWYRIGQSPWSGNYYASADAFYNNGQTSGSLSGTPFVDPNVPDCYSPPPPPVTYSETTGGAANTWTNYTNAGGTQGPTIPGQTTVQIGCKLTGFKVANGNTWWYRVAQSPWNNQYYVSADAFYNNGATSGSLQGTPFVDGNVPNC